MTCLVAWYPRVGAFSCPAPVTHRRAWLDPALDGGNVGTDPLDDPFYYQRVQFDSSRLTLFLNHSVPYCRQMLRL